jgi:hypothetical protein
MPTIAETKEKIDVDTSDMDCRLLGPLGDTSLSLQKSDNN